MSGYVRCACCNLPIPVTDDDIGLTVTCPRTNRLIPVKPADIQAGSPSPAKPGAASPSPAPAPIAIPKSTSSTSPALPPSSTKPNLDDSTPHKATPRRKAKKRAPRSAEPPASKQNWLLVLMGVGLMGLIGLMVLGGIGVYLFQTFRSETPPVEEVNNTNKPESTPFNFAPSTPPAETPAPETVPSPSTTTPQTSTKPTAVASTGSPSIGTPSATPATTPPVAASPGTPSVSTHSLPESLTQVATTYRHEVVRVNHPRNCVMCHTPSFQQTDLVRGAVPDPKRPLPPPTTPAYYMSGGQFVSADTTYLRQDFSVVQPVLNAGNWSSHQRYDYFVTIQKVDAAPATIPTKDSPYRKSIEFVIRELSGRDPTRDADWMAQQRKVAVAQPDTRLVQIAQLVSLQTDPKALIALKDKEFAQPLLSTPSDELGKTIKNMQETHGATATRTALIAYLYPLTQTGEAATRAKAMRLLVVVTGNTPDAKLPAALSTAASAASPAIPDPPPVVTGAEDRGTAPAGSEKDARGLPIYSLSKRIDLRKTEELEKELLGIREISLDSDGTTTSSNLITLAQKRKKNGEPYPGTVIACEGRPELAGLPFRIGLDATLTKEKAEALHALSKGLRETVQSCIQRDDPRPNTDALYQRLISPTGGAVRPKSGRIDPKKWTAPEAVPCIQQILAAENHDVRRLACELLMRIETAESTEVLVRWTVFETDPSNRAAAVEALRSRMKHNVSQQLLQYIRYPWPRAAEHAAEALVALNCKEAIPQLATMYDLPDPDAPFQVLSKTPSTVPAPVAGVAEPPKINPPVGGLNLEAASEIGANTATTTLRAAEEATLESHIKAATDPDKTIREQAAKGLATFLTNPDLSFRRSAAEALAQMGAEAEPVAEAIKAATTDADLEVRKSASRALEKIDDAIAARKAAKIREEILIVAKDLKAKESATRIKALEQIATYGTDANNIVGEQLIEALMDKTPSIQKAASNALEKVNPKVYPHAIELLSGTNRGDAASQLKTLGTDAAIVVPLLLAKLGDSHLVKDTATGKPIDLFDVIAKIAPKDKRFAAAVLASITAQPANTGGSGGVVVRSDNRGRRVAALAHLNVIEAATKDKVKALVSALDEGGDTLRVIAALEEFGKDAAPALPLLKKLKSSPVEGIRKAASKAIGKIE